MKRAYRLQFSARGRTHEGMNPGPNGDETAAAVSGVVAASIPVLETKLYAPRWHADSVARPALVERIRGGANGKLTVISAPAGAGKTTLLAEWLGERQATDGPAGWVSLDQGDNDPASFWAHVIRALAYAQSGVGAQALAMVPSNASNPTAFLTSLINDLAAAERDFILILDDYHLIEAPEVHAGVAFLLDHLPSRMHVIIASRADPPLPVARMRARSEVTELRATDLRFTAVETMDFCNRVMALGLAEADVSALEQRTEGWIAGLKLAALSLHGHRDARQFITAFSGDTRYIADYLVEEVLHGQRESERRFLLATAILERLSGPLCDAITGERGSQAVLERLEKNNLFLIALDDRREWYRYHHLFAEVLQAHALREDQDAVRERHRRASDWYERNGSTGDAVRHAWQADDLERVAILLERAWPAKDRSYQTGQWLARVKALPEALIRARPVLNMGYAWGLLNAGELEAADRQLRDVEAWVASSPGDFDRGDSVSTAGDAHQVRSLPRELATAQVYLAQARGDAAGTVAHATRLLTLIADGDHGARATAQALLALAHWATGSLETAHRTFADALESMRQAGAILDVIRGTFVLGDIRATQGRLREAEHSYHAGLQFAAAQGHDGRAEVDELYLGLSELHYERGDIAEAARLLQIVEQSAERASHAGNRHRWCRVMARIAAARGELDRALHFLAEAERYDRRDPVPRVRPIPAIRARIHLAQGRVADAVAWASAQNVEHHDALSFLAEFEHITLARVLIARHRNERDGASLHRAVALLEPLSAAAMTGGRLPSVIETAVLQSLAQHALGNTRAALDAVVHALELAEPEGFIRVFVDEGAAMRDILRLGTARGFAGAYMRRVLAAFDGPSDRGHSPGPPDPQDSSESGTPHPAHGLTSRELEILRLLSVAMRNQEIADQLGISLATVKRHVANIYNKLDARHRTEALRRASALKLL